MTRAYQGTFLFAIENKKFTWPSSSFMRCSCGGIDEGIRGKLEALVLDTESHKGARFSASANVFDWFKIAYVLMDSFGLFTKMFIISLWDKD